MNAISLANDIYYKKRLSTLFINTQNFKLSAFPCQHLAGSSIVEKFVTNLCDPSENFNVILDMLGYDGWPAAYALTEIAKGNKVSTGTICHTSHETSFVGEVIANKIFSSARDGALKIPGFPDFLTLVKDLKNRNVSTSAPQYNVCTPLPDGTLVVKSALIQLWTEKNESFRDEAVPWLSIIGLLWFTFWGNFFNVAINLLV